MAIGAVLSAFLFVYAAPLHEFWAFDVDVQDGARLAVYAPTDEEVHLEAEGLVGNTSIPAGTAMLYGFEDRWPVDTCIRTGAAHIVVPQHRVHATLYQTDSTGRGGSSLAAGRLLPTDAYGIDHVIPSAGEHPEDTRFIAILAPQETSVRVTARAAFAPGDGSSGEAHDCRIDAFPAGTTRSFDLDAGSGLLLVTLDDPIGTRVVADDPVAVFTGASRATIGDRSAGDAILEQVPPVSVAGRLHVACVPAWVPYDAFHLQMRIIPTAPEDTRITVWPQNETRILPPSGTLTFPVRQDTAVEADRPVLVQTSTASGAHHLDVASLLQPPVEAWDTHERLHVLPVDAGIPGPVQHHLLIATHGQTTVTVDDADLAGFRTIRGTSARCVEHPLQQATDVVDIVANRPLAASMIVTGDHAALWYGGVHHPATCLAPCDLRPVPGDLAKLPEPGARTEAQLLDGPPAMNVSAQPQDGVPESRNPDWLAPTVTVLAATLAVVAILIVQTLRRR